MYCELPEFHMVCEYIECVFVKINCMGHDFIVGVVYRPPNSNISDFNDSIHDILEKVSSYPCYIMGDFNLDLLKHELHRPTEKFLDIMYANSYIPIINRPTRVTRDTCTLIDNIFTNNISINAIFSMEYLQQTSLIIISCSTSSKVIMIKMLMTMNTKLSVSLMNLESTSLQKRFKTLTGPCEIHAGNARLISRNSIHCLKLSMMEHSHWLELKCDIEIAFPGWQMGWKNLSNIKINYTGFHWNIPHLIIFQNTKIIKINFLPFWRKKKRIIIDQKLFQIRIISGKCGTSSNKW